MAGLGGEAAAPVAGLLPDLVQGIAVPVVRGLTDPVRAVVGGPAGTPGPGSAPEVPAGPPPVVDAPPAPAGPPLGTLAGALRPVSGRLDEAVASLVAPLGPIVAPPSAPPDSGDGGAAIPPVTGAPSAAPVLAFGAAGGGAGLPDAGLTPAASAPPALAPAAIAPDLPARAPLSRVPAAPSGAPEGGPFAGAPAPSFPALPVDGPAVPSARPAVPGAPASSGAPARLISALPAGEQGARQGGAPGPAAPGPRDEAPPSAPPGLSGLPGGQGTALLFGIAALCGLVGLARPPDGLRRLPPAPATPVPVALIPSLERPG